MPLRRVVSNEEYQAAYENKDNRAVLRSVSNQYRELLSFDDRESAELVALWRALQGHREEFGQKFTGSLYRFCHWACRHTLRTRKRLRERERSLAELGDKEARSGVEQQETSAEVRHVFECMRFLSREQQDMVRRHVFEEQSSEEIGLHYGYSKEAARVKVDAALARLKELCVESGVFMGEAPPEGEQD